MPAYILRNLRTAMTKHSNLVCQQITWMVSEPDNPAWRSPDGLPSWWPFWSDRLKQNVRTLYRLGYELRNAEHNARGREAEKVSE